MRRFTWALVAACLVIVNVQSASAQGVDVVESPSDKVASSLDMPSSSEMSPEMWVYLQETKRYDDPKQAVRRKAEMRAAQRQARLAAQRWFGVSNLRPVANPIPYYGSYSPSWVGNSRSPYSWYGAGFSHVTYHTVTRR